MSIRGSFVPQNDDVLSNFVLWEQSVRRYTTPSYFGTHSFTFLYKEI